MKNPVFSDDSAVFYPVAIASSRDFSRFPRASDLEHIIKQLMLETFVMIDTPEIANDQDKVRQASSAFYLSNETPKGLVDRQTQAFLHAFKCFQSAGGKL